MNKNGEGGDSLATERVWTYTWQAQFSKKLVEKPSSAPGRGP
ncbi:hypothetical protein ACLB1N_11960 [Escherichia coli]